MSLAVSCTAKLRLATCIGIARPNAMIDRETDYTAPPEAKTWPLVLIVAGLVMLGFVVSAWDDSDRTTRSRVISAEHSVRVTASESTD